MEGLAYSLQGACKGLAKRLKWLLCVFERRRPAYSGAFQLAPAVHLYCQSIIYVAEGEPLREPIQAKWAPSTCNRYPTGQSDSYSSWRKTPFSGANPNKS